MSFSFILKNLVIPLTACIWSVNGFAQQGEVDLAKLIVGKTIKGHNRDVSLVTSGTKGTCVHLNEKPGSGVAWLEEVEFKEGVIEFDVKGRNVVQKSFVGIAFHGSNDSTYDAVYFRPFNFKSLEEERRNHSVQYISLPKFDWPKLRSEFHNQYEKPVNPAPDPEEWFHCRLVVKNQEVNVFVNGNISPSLTVKQLAGLKGSKVGFWVGHASDGDFANISIK
ncbi:hypothetical protein DYBT9275_03166 [Dyadobacter sp. CECT 9275]|uniref:3-keto-alpha-glucoside-1,2-lyase/3-keto-2-hydroxy-glucal hydratase domain-containing protein n=1 Tax=Dyadobacter helix TaxID=2822344 RepID=A0A916JDJ3_9BACT|nr:family 16 glycoside hydrolase [Dyadobacter sp. CECT 9275]CAG5003500.1 hypothetical protein DYBT9275_03166 [Dyadobacter sp. CECT 9275]